MMNDHLEKLCEELQAELGALRKKMQILEAKQAESKVRAIAVAGRRFGKNILITLIPLLGLLAAGGLLYGQGAVDALFIDNLGNATFIGNVGIGPPKPSEKLQVSGGKIQLDGNQQIKFTDTDTSNNLKLQLWSGNGLGINEGTLFYAASGRHSWRDNIGTNERMALTTGADGGLTITGTGNSSFAGNVGVGTTDPGAKLDVNGVARAKVFAATTPLRNRMYPDGAIVYQDIFEAKDKNVVAKLGNPAYDETTYNTSNREWYNRRIIKFGGNNEADGNGLKVTIPRDFDTVWIRVLGDRWNSVHAYFLDGGKEDLGIWTGGWRGLNSYAPDGTLADGAFIDGPKFVHQWVPIPAGRAGELALISKPSTDQDFWISGVAFSKNPWAHAVQSAVGYHWRVNGGEATFWAEGWNNWHGDSLSKINPKTIWELKVPVVPSGRDKLLYLIEHNNDWNGTMHTAITINGNHIQRFMATYDNPFARHWNGKIYARYIAARIPAALIPANARYLSVRIDMSKQENGIHFREIGTHDTDVPWAD